MQAVAETATGRGKGSVRRARRLRIAGGSMLVAASASVCAAPTGGKVTAGAASIGVSGNTTTVTQASQNLSLNWSSFNVGSQETVNFVQPGSGAIAVNRISDVNGSQILGHLNANGQVYLINPNGVLFGAGAQVNVGGLVASTLDIADSALNGATRSFSGTGTGAVVNQGSLHAASGGFVALLGNQVSNQGVIQADLGSVALGAGSAVTLKFAGNSLVGLQVDQSTLDNLAENRQLIQADGGRVMMSAGAADSLLTSVVNNSGVIEARGVVDQGGTIVLQGGQAAGQVNLGGTLDASSAKGAGGTVTATAAQVNVGAGALVDADGALGGGTINIGGGWEGGGGVAQAAAVSLAASARLQASATQSGDGGQIVVRSDVDNAASTALVQGSMVAHGGPGGGNGGRIETSAAYLDVGGSHVDTSAAKGNGGLWLLDPSQVDIIAGTGSVSLSGGNYTNNGTGTTTTLQASTISAALSSGTNVTIICAGNSNNLGDIDVNAPITKTGGGTQTLTLQAQDTIVINQPISSTTGALNVSLLADSGHVGTGIILLNNNISTNGGNIGFGDGSQLNGVMVGGDVYVQGSSAINLTTGGGSVTFNGQLVVANTNGLSIDTITGATTGGNVTFAGSVDSGNTFALQSSSLNWNTALATYKSGSGANVGDTYLATIDSSLINAVASYTAGYSAAWLGGQRVVGIGSDATWRWVSGPDGLMNGGQGKAFFIQNGLGQTCSTSSSTCSGGSAIGSNYVNWNPATPEPNNYNGSNLHVAPTTGGAGENVMQFVGTAGQWNDLNPYTQYLPSVVERNLAPSSLTINAGSGTSAGNVTFAGPVGNVQVLNNLNVTGHLINLSSTPVINTAGTQTYNGQVTVGGVNKNIVTESAPNLVQSYGTSAPGTTFVPTCSGADCSYVTSAGSVAIQGGIAASGSGMLTTGLYTLTASGAFSSNTNDYIMYNGGTLLVNPLALTVTPTVTGGGKVYNGSAAATVTLAATGVVSGDTLTFSDTSATYANANAGVAKTVTVSGITATGTNLAEYTIASTATATGTIAQAPLSVGGATVAAGKTYDGTTAAALSGGTLLGTRYGSDAPTLVQAGTFATRNAGAGIVVTAGDTLGGTGASNYVLTQPTTTLIATIAPATLTLTAAANSKTYDGTTVATAAPTTSGLVSGDTVATSEAYASKNVLGSNASTLVPTATVSDGNGGANYHVVAVNANGTITPATLTLTAAGYSKTYDGTTGAAAAPTTSGLLSGDTVATSEAYASKNVLGSNGSTLVPTASVSDGNGGANYHVVAVNANGTITPATLTLTAAGNSKTYDGTTGATATPTTSGLMSGDTAATSEAYASKNVLGSNASTLVPAATVSDGNGGANYQIVAVNANGTITPATLTLTAAGNSKTYDGTTGATATPTTSGLMSGDTAATSETYASKNVLGSNGSTLVPTAIVSDGNGGANYQIVAVNANGTITPATLTLTAAGNSKTYDGTTGASATPTTSGLLSGDIAATSEAYASKNVLGSNGSTLVPAAIVSDGNGGANYQIVAVNVNGTITPATLTLTAAGNSKAYDGTTGASATPTTSGLLSGDTAATSEAFASKNVLGNNASTLVPTAIVSDGNGGANYQIVAVNANGTITPALLTLTAAGNSKTYDGTTGASATPTTSGLLSGDTAATSEAYASKNVLGNNASTLVPTAIVSDGNGGANYQIVAVNANGTITPALLTLTAAGNSKTYDGTTGASATPTISGLMSGDSVAASEAYASKNVLGSNGSTLVPTAIVSDGNGGANYRLVANNAPGTITQLSSVTWTGGASGNWFDPANWAGGAVPDLSNVAGVVIPAGITVNFSSAGQAPAEVGPVNLNSIGVGGKLLVAAGTLNVGGGGVTLGALSQSGGLLNSSGPIAVGSFNQTGGATVTAGNFSASSGYSQGGTGSLAVGGNATLGAGGGGGIVLGNLQTAGNLSVSTTAGAITQAAGTVLTVAGTAGFTALDAGAPADVDIANTGNTFSGLVSISGANVNVAAAGPLSLGKVQASANLGVSSNGALDFGTTSVGGRLTATSHAGNITQSGPLTVGAGAGVDAGGGNVSLLNAGNNLGRDGTYTGATVAVTGQQSAGTTSSAVVPLITVLTSQVLSGTATAATNANATTSTGAPGASPSRTPEEGATSSADGAATSDAKTAPNNGVVYRDLNRHAPMVLINNGIRLPEVSKP